MAVPTKADWLRLCLAQGPMSARQLIEKMEVSQPTVSRLIATCGDDIVRISTGTAIQYAIRDPRFDPIPVYRVSPEGTITKLGTLFSVRPEGFVMVKEEGSTRHTDGLPWWLLDMRPQGFLGRAYAARHAAALGLPARLTEWSDHHALRALVAHGHDVVGNLLLGDVARDNFVDAPDPSPVRREDYESLAHSAELGDVPGSSAGGEQPKFAAYTGRHVLVKFTPADDNPVAVRWRDLLLAEHHASQALLDAGIPASRSEVIEVNGRWFLEIERFDRIGPIGRHGVFSLGAVEAEFVGDANAPWPVLAQRLAAQGVITNDAVSGAALLYAFGLLIGNTDMHNGNLSFVSDQGRPYSLAPAYDMLPMGFAPRSGGALPYSLQPANLHPSVPLEAWRRAFGVALDFRERMRADSRFTGDWERCADSIGVRLEETKRKIARLNT